MAGSPEKVPEKTPEKTPEEKENKSPSTWTNYLRQKKKKSSEVRLTDSVEKTPPVQRKLFSPSPSHSPLKIISGPSVPKIENNNMYSACLAIERLADNNLIVARALSNQEKDCAILKGGSIFIVGIGGAIYIVIFIGGLVSLIISPVSLIVVIGGCCYAREISKEASAYILMKEKLLKKMKEDEEKLDDESLAKQQAIAYLLFEMINKVHLSSFSSSLKKKFYSACEGLVIKDSLEEVLSALKEVEKAQRNRWLPQFFNNQACPSLVSLWEEARRAQEVNSLSLFSASSSLKPK